MFSKFLKRSILKLFSSMEDMSESHMDIFAFRNCVLFAYLRFPIVMFSSHAKKITILSKEIFLSNKHFSSIKTFGIIQTWLWKPFRKTEKKFDCANWKHQINTHSKGNLFLFSLSTTNYLKKEKCPSFYSIK